MKKNCLIILTLICILAVNTLSARYKDIPVTRDLNPDRKYITYAEYFEQHPFRPTEFSEINRISSNQREEGFLIIVELDLYPEIADAMATYQNDLTSEGYNSFLIEFSGTVAFDMKIQIMLYFQEENVNNVILIGDLPVVWFEMFEDFNNNGIWDPDENWVDFPIELYFSDIDGSWEDIDNNGIYDYHEGDKHPEIGIGRIIASNMSYLGSSEAELINSYFQRNHLYRNGFLQNPDIALAYIDDDWAYWGPEYQEAMQFVYPETELINDINQTTANDYRTNRLTADYEFIQVHVHSGPDAHYFYENNGNNYNTVTNYQISYLNPTSYFYNLFACSNSRFTENNNMGGMYLLGNDYCLGTIGSTKTGSMLWFEDFYEPLSLDENLGEALRQWWELSVDVGDDWMWQRAWFYGMAIQGDPSLKLTYEDNVVFVPDDYPTIQEAINAVENGDIVLVNPGTYVENINFNGKNITVASLFLTTHDTTYISQTIIDGNQDGSVVTIGCSNDSISTLSGFTIKNGLATYGGGIRINFLTSPTIKDNMISNNQAQYGGGIYNDCGSPLIKNNIIKDNYSTFVGGIIAYGGDIKIIENIIVNNQGSGIHIESTYYNILIENNIISNNYGSTFGGGICIDCEVAGTRIRNNLIINNSSISTGSAIFLGVPDAYYYELSNNTIVNNDNIVPIIYACDNNEVYLFNNIIHNGADTEIFCYENNYLNVAYSNIYGGYPGIGNFDESPNFVDSLYDFHLQDTSPCIGVGIDEIEINGIWYYAPLFDIEGNPRPDPAGSIPDMGAYENPLGEPQVGITQNQLPSTDYHLTNYPNPFNPSTTILFDLTAENAKDAELIIYNIKGQKVRTFSCRPELVEGSITWDGTDQNNQPVSSGIYFYKLKAGEFSQTRKMLMLK